VSGYESSKGRYVILTENELEAIDIELSRTVETPRFVGAAPGRLGQNWRDWRG
jgi:non-homologous end joining protein Ku